MPVLRIHMVILLVILAFSAEAQQENRHIRKGNSHYQDGDYKKAEIDYIKSIEASRDNSKGVFNLGNALYMQQNYLQAMAAFDSLRTYRIDDDTRSRAYYNLANSMLKLALDSAHLAPQVLPPTVESYKQSLRLNPHDMDAKYNLAYAQRLLENSRQQQQDQQQEKQQDQQDQQDQQQQQDQQDQQQEQQEQQQEQGDQQTQEQQQQQSEMQQISKEDAERILEALKNNEKQTLEKLKQNQIKQMRVIRSEKDW